jgi:hypothetical protein
MKRIEEQVFRGLALVGKVALFALGVFAVLALAVVTAVLVPVMLAATIVPSIVMGLRRDQSVERNAGNVQDVLVAPNAVATSRQQAG